jgi:hypothetical protein
MTDRKDELWRQSPNYLGRFGHYAITSQWLERHHGPLKTGDVVEMQLDDDVLRVFVHGQEIDYGNDPPYVMGHARP